MCCSVALSKYYDCSVPRKRMQLKATSAAREYTDVSYGASAEEDYENATEIAFMSTAAGTKSQNYNSDYELPDLVMPRKPETLYEEIKQSPVVENSDQIELNLCPAYGTTGKL